MVRLQDSYEKERVFSLVHELTTAEQRESALLELSKKREVGTISAPITNLTNYLTS